jgi:hypothetical protein
MKFTKRGIVSSLLVVSLLIIVGCSKKPEEGKPAGATAPAAGAPAAVDTEKPVAEVQAQAETMTVENLKATALKYKEAILAKQADISALAAKVKEIPITEALGEEAKKLKTDLTGLETSLKSLKDRFQVYYNTLKTKGGDLAGLEF